MNRRFGFLWIWGLGTAAIAAIVGAIAYHAGQTATVVTTAPRGSEVIYRGYDGFGFFPFRLFAWRSWGRGPWGYGGKHYHDHTHDPASTTPQTTPPATKLQDPTI